MVSLSMVGEVILSARNLNVVFPRESGGEVRAVSDLSLDIRAGEFVGLMGQPGCGKSTAAAALMGLVKPPGHFASGAVSFLGRELLALEEPELRQVRGKDVGLIVQNPRTSLHPMLKVGVQIANVYRAHNKASAKDAWAHAIEMLRMVGINDPERRAHAYPHELSTGMTQRVLIAMALSSRPRLLIADEPTSGLDVTIQAQFLDQMWEATQATGSAVLLVTQNLGIVANYCDRVLIMTDGTIVESAPVRDFFTSPQNDYSKRVLALQRQAQGGGSQAGTPSGARSGAALVELRDLSKDFDIRGSKAKVHAADRVSFTIKSQECLGLVGESGSGKTTIGRCLLRLETPTAGEISFRGAPLHAISEEEFRAYRAKLQIVFQDPFELDESTLERGGDHRRDARPTYRSQGRSARYADRRTAENGRSRPCSGPRLAAPTVGRQAATYRNRARDRDQSRFYRARRTDFRTHAGDDRRDHRTLEGSIGTTRPCLPVHLA